MDDTIASIRTEILHVLRKIPEEHHALYAGEEVAFDNESLSFSAMQLMMNVIADHWAQGGHMPLAREVIGVRTETVIAWDYELLLTFREIADRLETEWRLA